jgi:hypothetical protein
MANVDPLYMQLADLKSQDTGFLPYAMSKAPEVAADIGQRFGMKEIEDFRNQGAQGIFKAAQEAGVQRPERFYQMAQIDPIAAEAAVAKEIQRAKVTGFTSDIAKRMRGELQTWLDKNPDATEEERTARMKSMSQALPAQRSFQETPEARIAVDEMSGFGGESGLSPYQIELLKDKEKNRGLRQDKETRQAEEADYKALEKTLKEYGIQKNLSANAKIQGNVEIITQTLNEIVAAGGEGLVDASKAFSSGDARSYQTILDSMVVRASPLAGKVMDSVRTAVFGGDGSQEDVGKIEAVVNKAQQMLQSTDARDKARASVMLLVLDYLKETSGVAVTAQEAGRLFDGFLTRGVDLAAVLDRVNMLARTRESQVQNNLRMAQEGIRASGVSGLVEMADRVIPVLARPMPQIPAELIRQFEMQTGEVTPPRNEPPPGTNRPPPAPPPAAGGQTSSGYSNPTLASTMMKKRGIPGEPVERGGRWYFPGAAQ